VIWRALITPDRFPRDWYGWATNQLGHIMIGLALACGLTLVHFWALGEFPYKLHLFALIGAGYLAFELAFQKWQGWDTVEDWIFVCVYGAGGAIGTVTEREVGSLIAALDLTAVAWAFAAAGGHLAAGIGWRLRPIK
jgi:hypothetical protein